ncbi:MAG: hypothetical protein WA056_15020 [Gallionella sp.]
MKFKRVFDTLVFRVRIFICGAIVMSGRSPFTLFHLFTIAMRRGMIQAGNGMMPANIEVAFPELRRRVLLCT